MAKTKKTKVQLLEERVAALEQRNTVLFEAAAKDSEILRNAHNALIEKYNAHTHGAGLVGPFWMLR